MNRQELDEIRQRVEAATPGPWTCDSSQDWTGEWVSWIKPINLMIPDEISDADVDLMVRARTYIPKLLAYIDELEAR